jgi:hypothetical protein
VGDVLTLFQYSSATGQFEQIIIEASGCLVASTSPR